MSAQDPANAIAPAIDLDARVETIIDDASNKLAALQKDDGHWVFELEADSTIPAEYILFRHYMGEIDEELDNKIAVYLRRIQEDHGGWPMFHGGDMDISNTVKAYWALKMIGDDINAPHMKKAREVILAHGGAAKSNIFTRITMALFGEMTWDALPFLRVELLLAPKFFFFHPDKVSYWARTVMTPLFILVALKPKAKNPRGVNIDELFVKPRGKHENRLPNPTGQILGEVMLRLDRLGRVLEPLLPKTLEKKAIKKAVDFITERLNGEDGLGAIFPAMVNTVMAFDALGYSHDDPDYAIARKSVDGLLVIKDEEAYCQPCVSPVWDTGLSLHAMLEYDQEGSAEIAEKASQWLIDRQILDVNGDWIVKNTTLPSGGWAFQYNNDHYPDVDDTSVVAMALHRVDPEKYREPIARAAEWIIGMQSSNGGWGAFDIDNDYKLLDQMPFADHGAMLDPPTVDVTARCISMLAQLGYSNDHPCMRKGIEYLRREQEEDGSWWGRWGTNYVYGTWSALCALNVVNDPSMAPNIERAVAWLKSRQRADGGWGEDCATYWEDRKAEEKASLPSQTAWALMGLMAAGEVNSDAVQRGVENLLETPREGARWHEEYFNAVGFPRVFYLRYHGYSAFFPLWALSRYRNLTASNNLTTPYGM